MLRYQVRDVSSPERQILFEVERDEPIIEGQTFNQDSMVYEVLSVQDDHGEFDGLIEVQRRAGPGTFR